jgi:hypothetical protein
MASQDAQLVSAVVQLLYDQQLMVGLLQLGHVTSAATLKMLGVMHMAFDIKHLTCEHRSKVLQLCKAVLLHLLLQDPDNAAMVAGAGTASKSHMGFSGQAVAGWLCNIEAREKLLLHFPALAGNLVERCLSSDDLEIEFSCLVTGVEDTSLQQKWRWLS